MDPFPSPLERRLACSHIILVQAATSASSTLSVPQALYQCLKHVISASSTWLHRKKARPDGGRDIETVAQWRTILMRTYDLTPFYRSTVGFDRLFSLLDQASETSPGYPPYNIERTGDNAYRISVAVSGFAQNELSIVAKENTLTIKGEKVANENGKDKSEVLYRGIAARAFERAFQLADFVVVKNASLEHGLLHVDLVREIPEAKKPRNIPIASGASAPQVVDAAADKAAA